MKTKLIFILLYILTFSSFLFAQVTITKSDYTSIFTIGSKYKSFADTLTESIDIGNAGGGNNWNFSGLTAHYVFEVNYISPPGTPFADTFSTANVVGYSINNFDGGGIAGTSKVWTYFSTTDASNLGSGNINVTSDSSSTDTTVILTKHFPPFVMYDFPIEANKSWSNKDSSESTSISSQGSFTTVVTTIYNISVDAWGTMVLPSGNSVEALRIREQSISTSYILGIPTFTSTTVTYSFMAKSGESLSILADNENPPTSGVITGSVGWGGDNLTGIEQQNIAPERFALQQNYPNPFNPTTTIQYSIPSVETQNFASVQLKIFDILGREVAVLVNKKQSSGNYKVIFNALSLPSGIYFISLKAGSFSEIRKMTLLK